MKKFLSLVLIFTVALSVCATAEPETNDPSGFGTIDEIGGWIGVYCNYWDDIFGSVLGSDLSFDTKKMRILSREKTGQGTIASVDVDGVIFDVCENGGDVDVLSMRVSINSKDSDNNSSLARCMAVTSAAFYDVPPSRNDMKDRFIGLMDVYMNGLEQFTDVLQATTKSTFSTSYLMLYDSQISQMLRLPQVYFCYIDGDMFFSTKDLAGNDQLNYEEMRIQFLEEYKEMSDRLHDCITAAIRSGNVSDELIWTAKERCERIKKMLLDNIEEEYRYSYTSANKLYGLQSDADYDALSGEDKALYNAMMDAYDEWHEKSVASVTDSTLNFVTRIEQMAANQKVGVNDISYLNAQIRALDDVAARIYPALKKE